MVRQDVYRREGCASSVWNLISGEILSLITSFNINIQQDQYTLTTGAMLGTPPASATLRMHLA